MYLPNSNPLCVARPMAVRLRPAQRGFRRWAPGCRSPSTRHPNSAATSSDRVGTLTLQSSPALTPRLTPGFLFFQFATYEQNFKEAAMRRYYAAASEPKRVAWYPTGHDLNDPQAVLDRGLWLHRHLGVGAIALGPPAEPAAR
jgi:hypothetical protein